MATLRRSLLVLIFIPNAVALFCYSCVFPAVSPDDCIEFPQRCPTGQRCLTSRAEGRKGDFLVVLYERSCVLPALCGSRGQRSTMGLNFTFTNECCDTHLCNGAPRPPTAWILLSLLALPSASG